MIDTLSVYGPKNSMNLPKDSENPVGLGRPVTEPPPEVSVVVAVWQELGALELCLRALESQTDLTTELIVVATAPGPGELELPPGTRWIAAPDGELIPHLWARGIARARGRIVATTTAQFEPDGDWLHRLVDAHARLGAAGIGGSFGPPQGAGPVDWATFLLRYGAWLDTGQEREVDDLAADNASYPRAVFEHYDDALVDGFWEPELHRRVREAGGTLVFVPEIRVTQRASFGVRRFCVQRWRHGYRFGRTRFQGRSRMVYAAAAAASPLVVPILLARLTRRVLGHRRDLLAPFLGSLPFLVLFLAAWTAGEGWGYLIAARSDSTVSES